MTECEWHKVTMRLWTFSAQWQVVIIVNCGQFVQHISGHCVTGHVHSVQSHKDTLTSSALDRTIDFNHTHTTDAFNDFKLYIWQHTDMMWIHFTQTHQSPCVVINQCSLKQSITFTRHRTALCCPSRRLTDYDLWPWPLTLTTNVATARK